MPIPSTSHCTAEALRRNNSRSATPEHYRSIKTRRVLSTTHIRTQTPARTHLLFQGFQHKHKGLSTGTRICPGVRKLAPDIQLQRAQQRPGSIEHVRHGVRLQAELQWGQAHAPASGPRHHTGDRIHISTCTCTCTCTCHNRDVGEGLRVYLRLGAAARVKGHHKPLYRQTRVGEGVQAQYSSQGTRATRHKDER